MRFLLTISLFFCSLFAKADHGRGVYMDITGRTVFYSGSKYTYGTHSGSITLTQASTSPNLTLDDTLLVTGSFSSMQANTMTGASGHNIVIDVWGAGFTSPSSYQQAYFYDLHYVKFIGGQYTNWWGTNFGSYKINDVTWESCRFINSRGAYKGQPFFQFDDPFASYTMQWDGSTLNKTFSNVKWYKCRLEGTTGVPLITISSNWGSTAENNRSIGRDFVFDTDTIGPTDGAGDGISGTGPHLTVKNCYFHAIGLSGNAHLAGVQWYGTVDFHDNYMDSSYASILRNYPLRWQYLDYADDSSFVYNNGGKHSRSYSFIEGNTTGLGGRTVANGWDTAFFAVVHNTVDSTTGYSYNDQGGGNHRWHGAVVDLVTMDSVLVADNAIFRPEMDYAVEPYSTDSASHNGYIYYEIGAAALHKTIRNNYSSRWSTGKVQDSTDYKPSAGSPLIGGGIANSFRTLDHFGVSVSGNNQDKGWAQYVSAGSPPSCTSNLTPVNLAYTGAFSSVPLTWSPAATADSFNVYVYPNGGSAGSPIKVAGTSYTKTGLSYGIVYRWYIEPFNSYGTASGCATSYTLFTTDADPSKIRVLRVPRKH